MVAQFQERDLGERHVVFSSLILKVIHHLCCILFVETVIKAYPDSRGGKMDSGQGTGKVLVKHVELEILIRPFLENIICLSTRLEAIRHPSTYFLFTPSFY